MSRRACSRVWYSVQYISSFFSVPLKDSAIALSKHTPRLPAEGRSP